MSPDRIEEHPGPAEDPVHGAVDGDGVAQGSYQVAAVCGWSPQGLA